MKGDLDDLEDPTIQRRRQDHSATGVNDGKNVKQTEKGGLGVPQSFVDEVKGTLAGTKKGALIQSAYCIPSEAEWGGWGFRSLKRAARACHV